MINSIVFCDIDGTIVPTCFKPNREMDNIELENIRRRIELLTLSKEIISLLHMIIKNTKLVFLTGRPKEWEDATYNLLKPINKKKYNIYFLNIEGKWSMEKYYKFKLDIIHKISEKYDIIYVIDDIIDLLKYIKKYFNLENKFLFLINGVYDSMIRNMVIKSRLM